MNQYSRFVGNGAGQTIAIVDAYNDPNINSDLAAFDKQFGLSAPPSFTVDNLGATTTNAGWALEKSLDVEWAHAVAPEANIVLVEASSASLNALFSAVSYASKLQGVSVVSMSWGTTEFWGESAYDSIFTTPAGHNGVTFVAASGDSGAWSGPMYPSVSPNVLAVGGTTLTLAASNTYGSETGWSDSTGGFSGYDSDWRFYESEPSYQTATLQAAGLSYGVRTTPDVSFNADPEHRCGRLRLGSLQRPVRVVPGRRHQRRHASMGRAGRDRRPGPGHGRKVYSFQHPGADGSLFPSQFRLP